MDTFFLYGATLALLIMLACYSRDERALFCAGVTAANWFIWCVICFAVGDYARWDLAFLLDSTTAAVFFGRDFRYFCTLSWILCGMHWLYGVDVFSRSDWYFWSDWLGRVQLASAGVFAAIAGGRRQVTA